MILSLILILVIVVGVFYFINKEENINETEDLVSSDIQSNKENEIEEFVKESVVENKEAKENFNIEQITLNTHSSGVLKIKRTFDYEESHNTWAKLTFIPDNTENSLLVSVMPPGVTGLENNIIYDNKIYFISNDNIAKIKYFNISDNEFRTVNETVKGDGYISSFFPTSEAFYYIAGPIEFGYCLDLPKDKCLNANLYKYDFDKDKVEVLAKDIKGSYVLGHDSNDSIYFSSSWADAGGWFATVYKYEDGKVEVYKSYSDASQFEEYENFISSLDGLEGHQSILLENGKLSPGPEISDHSKNNYFFID